MMKRTVQDSYPNYDKCLTEKNKSHEIKTKGKKAKNKPKTEPN